MAAVNSSQQGNKTPAQPKKKPSVPASSGEVVVPIKTENKIPVQQKDEPNPATPPAQGEYPKDNATPRSDIEILSDTMGVDFGPYLKRVVYQIREHWYNLIPESARTKQGEVIIEFAILKDGRIAGLRIQKSSGNDALDRPVYGAITKADPLPALPPVFSGQYLRLRFRFQYNPEKKSTEAGATEANHF